MRRNMLPPLTQKIYAYIRDYIEEHDNLSPTLREIAQGCDMHHTSLLRHLDKLEAKEWIIREMGRARTIRLGRNAPDAPSR